MSYFDKYSLDDDKRPSRRQSQSFDDWYGQFSRIRNEWHTNKDRIKSELREDFADFKRDGEAFGKNFSKSFRDELNRPSSGSSNSESSSGSRSHPRITGKTAGEVAGSALRTLVSVIDEAVQSSASRKGRSLPEPERMRLEQYRRREEEYRRLTHKIESAEHRVEKKRKSAVTLAIFAAIFGVSWTVSDFGGAFLPVVFAGFAALSFGKSRKWSKNFPRLYAEREAFGGLPAPPAYSNEAEKTILRHAFEHDGRVYPQMLAVQSELSLAEIEAMLKVCVDKRLASIELDEKGRPFYYFASLDESDPYASASGTPS
jgi:hypothetical protein